MDLFLAIVNRVTSPHRHGQKISKRALDELSNDQIIMEAWLAKNKPKKVIRCNYQGGCVHLNYFICECIEPCKLHVNFT